MKTWTRIVSAIASVSAVVAGTTALYYGLYLPRSTQPRAGSVTMSADRIARGKYLFEVVADCDGCHSERDYSRFGGPVVVSGRGKGQIIPEKGPVSPLVTANITPDKETGLGNWTDGEKIRAIREGISRDGRTLFPMMPYKNFSKMSDYDVESLVAYMNTLAPVKSNLPKMKIPFPINVLMKTYPEPVARVQSPDRGRNAEYGAYLATLGHCMDCHTPADGHNLDESMKFAGGRVFDTPLGKVVSANITPDPDTGIGRWSEDYFVQRFTLQRTYAVNGAPKLQPGQFTLMPWLNLSQMDPDDLSAIYRYLQTQSTIPNKVDKHPGATQTAGF
ncbi:c-type cytochrome [Paludibaculum fermentans]|uniref:C-type cytochrome n=1 Tax=Paludibaculum fermentans TaxID=1473598 RepID=A0A7S7NPJ2_PALFE|nr:cytochrome c [Paludibaculum fermentans]QOY87417.1 c-type cytochrome [Paludibaculum fermentans]